MQHILIVYIYIYKNEFDKACFVHDAAYSDSIYIYKNEFDKACFIYDAANSDSKDLTKRTVADKILKNKAFDIAKDLKYDRYQRGLTSMVL